MGKPFYITTTLPYVNAAPHIGFAMEMIQADTIARYHRLLGDEVLFNTGTDEHGMKVYKKAVAEKKDPQTYADEYAEKFHKLKEALNLSYDHFIRTTDPLHKKAAQEFWRRCAGNGDIYKAKYKIKYCVGCELERTESELINGHCPLHPNLELEIIQEENYFFKFSKYQKPLLALYKKNPGFVLPKSRLSEITNFVSSGLNDFSISRLKKKMPWGVEVPEDPDHVMYVWFDALVNYISTLGWPQNQKEFSKWWPGVQIAGKDNLRQQSAMWQAMLLSANLPPSKQILIHGFITFEGRKMSKTIGNVIDPYKLVNDFGVDAVRYYLLKTAPLENDLDFSLDHFREVYNADLANGLGNLLQRVTTLCEISNIKYQISKTKVKNKKFEELFNVYKFNEILVMIWEKITNLDKYINETKPWTLKGKELEKILHKPIAGLLEIAYLLKPFLPQTSQKIEEIFSKGEIKAPKKPLFPRLK